MSGLRRAGALVALVAACAAPGPVPEPEGAPAEAEAALSRGDEHFAARAYLRARERYLAAAATPDPAVRVQALAQVARMDSIRGAPDAGRPFLAAAAEEATPDEPLGWSRMLLVRGVYEREDGERARAVRTFEELFAYCLERGLPERAIDAAHMVALAADDFAVVEVWTRRGLALAEREGEERWQAVLWNNLGWELDEAGRHAEALDALARARELHHRTGGEHEKLVADWSLGHALRRVGRLDEAEDLLRQTYSWAGRRYAATPSQDTAEWVGHAAWELGEVEAARGRPAEAAAWLHAARRRLVEAGIARWWPAGLEQLDARLAELLAAAPGE